MCAEVNVVLFLMALVVQLACCFCSCHKMWCRLQQSRASKDVHFSVLQAGLASLWDSCMKQCMQAWKTNSCHDVIRPLAHSRAVLASSAMCGSLTLGFPSSKANLLLHAKGTCRDSNCSSQNRPCIAHNRVKESMHTQLRLVTTTALASLQTVSYLVCNVVYTKCHLCLAELPIWLVLILQQCSSYQRVYLERICVAMTESMTIVMLVWRARLCVLDVLHGMPWSTLSRTGNMAVCQSLATTTQSSPGLKGKAVSASMAALLKSTKRF